MAVGRTRAAVVALLVALLVADAAVHVSLRSRFRRLHRVEDTGIDAFSTANDDVTEGTFTQKLCHFNPQVTDTWAQRFWQNDQFFKDGGPQFLNIGGEGPESGKRISHPSLPIVQWASQVNARIWNLEHRFYGKSRPTADQSVENLKFLNSRQALEDLADFIAAKNKELNIQNPRWVVFGGSYPGALTLWFRVVHPELTVGGVGSSAPIEVVTDFFDYLRVCEDSFRTFSPQCAENIRAGFESLREHLDSADQRAELDQAFNFQPPLASMELDWKNLQNVYMAVVGNFMESVQYSRVNAGVFATNASIPDVCAIMTQPAINPVARLAKVNAYMQQVFGYPSITYDSYDDTVTAMRETSFDADAANDRSWVWQTCNEFGYFQSTDYNGIFGTSAPVDFDINLCADVFGAEFTIDEIRSRVQATRDHYGRARDYNGTNVVIPNGSLDPWHALGTYKPKDPSAVSVLIDGTAHCADMEPANDTTDPQSLKDARTTIWANIQQWLGASEQPAGQPVEETGLTARRAPEFRTTICFDCDAESGNKNKLRNPMPEHLKRKFGNRFIGGRHRTGGFRRRDLREKKFAGRPRSNSVTTGWITQKVDHFDDSNTKTFQQLIYKNDKYFDKSAKNPVVFVYNPGEGGAGEEDIEWEDIPMVTWAKQFGAMLYVLEHRFYGQSQPFDTMSIDNLKYLTSEQAKGRALADIATFITNTNQANGWTNARWIPFGGSYAGACTAWMRALYPDLTFAAVGSSGPVEAIVDFYGYMQTVEASLRAYDDKCGDSMKKALTTVHKLMTTVDGRQQLDDGLYVEPPFGDADWIDQYDVMDFYSSLTGPLCGAVQYTDHFDNIEPICGALTDPSADDLDKVSALSGGEAFHDINGTVDSFKYDGDERAWFWQTCNEFGFYQSTDIGGDNAYGSEIPVNYFLLWCTGGYDPSLTRDELERRIDATNQRYGGARGYKATKSIQVYGTLDPWHTLGFYGPDNSHGEDVITILINGTAHCADMEPPESTDVPDLVQARKTITAYLTKWLT
ncbi:Peptidase S28 family-containing protein [Aphelenchoides fujianensis]|nr:Peptidase S28 family-containing protein [Aphelenchoides fujianensis]